MSRNVTEFDWNDEAKARLRQMCAEGYSAGQIAKQWGVTRNVIGGMINRMRCARGEPTELALMAATIPQPARKSRAKPKSEHKPRVPKPKHQPLPTLSEPAKPRALPAAEAVTETAVATIDLTPTSCRWALNSGPDWMFCGEKVLAGKSWCSTHNSRCFSNGTRSEREAA